MIKILWQHVSSSSLREAYLSVRSALRLRVCTPRPHIRPNEMRRTFSLLTPTKNRVRRHSCRPKTPVFLILEFQHVPTHPLCFPRCSPTESLRNLPPAWVATAPRPVPRPVLPGRPWCGRPSATSSRGALRPSFSRSSRSGAAQRPCSGPSDAWYRTWGLTNI